jgi:hypothetical protein
VNIGFLRGWLVLSVALVLGASVASAPGCGLNYVNVESCDHPFIGHVDNQGEPDPCCTTKPCPGHCTFNPCPDAGADASDEDAMMDAAGDAPAEAGPICPGACLPLPPPGWSAPVVVWQGPATGTPPPCPAPAPVAGVLGYMGIDTPDAACGACSCATPDGGCGLPSSLTAGSAPCGDGGTSTPFDPPPAWDGGCTADDAIPAGAQCNGAPCVQSIASSPLTILDESCAPSTADAGPLLPATWTTQLVACTGTVDPAACGAPSLVCAPVSAPPPSFQWCVYQTGNPTCPPPYTQAYAVSTGIDDERGCSPCACGAPVGSACTGTLSIFSDATCSDTVGALYVTSDPGACLTLPAPPPPPPALGSKWFGKPPVYTPGACAPSGGQPAGQATGAGPVTVCCIP